MSAFRPFRTFAVLATTFLILAQCSEKTSVQHVREGLEHLKNARYNDALFAYQKAVQVNPKNPDDYQVISNALSEVNSVLIERRFDVVDNDLEKVLKDTEDMLLAVDADFKEVVSQKAADYVFLVSSGARDLMAPK